MKSWKLYCAGLALAAGLAPAALAQAIPGAPPTPVAPAAAPAAAPAPAGGNIWSKLCPTADQKAACKAKLCASPIGQLLNNMLAPAAAFSGGILGPCCPTINPAGLAMPADSPAGAAARVQQDEAGAAARRAAIRYMAGADCHYWPEVTEALIGALRSDRNECVRMEAALALNRGCCCNRATMKALTLTISGSTEDGNPAEDSERVKCAAMAALNHCLANFTEVVPAEAAGAGTGGGEKPPVGGGEKPPVGGEKPPPMSQKGPFSPTEFYHHAENLPEKAVVEAARRAVEHVTPVAVDAPSPAADHSLVGIVRAAMTPPPAVSVVPAPAVDKPMGSVVAPAVMVQPAKTWSPAPVVPPGVGPVVPSGVAPAGFAAPSVKAGVLPPARVSTVPAPAPASVRVNAAVVANEIAVLHDSINPEDREKAADSLGACDGWANPNVVQALVEAARSDAAPLVRAASLRSLTRMNVRTLPVATVAQALKTDPDPRVRTEAEQAIKQFSGSSHPQ